MVQIQEEEDTYEQLQQQQQQQQQHHAHEQSSSSNNKNKNKNKNKNPEDSPSPASSISSDHTFHGFSPPKSPSLSPHSFLPLPLPAPAPDPAPAPAPAPVARLVHDQPEVVTKTQPVADTGLSLGHRATRERKLRSTPGTVLSQARTHKVVKRVGLVLRFLEVVVCLISFCVMASDKRRGWALDSFDRYIEFRYSMTVNVIGFAYSVLQGLDLLLQLTTGKNLAGSKLRYCFDFAIDQILAYLLLSSSSSAFTRVDDWISNWGPDKFPAMASASVGVSFVAFIAFALSSLVSGYTLSTHGHT